MRCATSHPCRCAGLARSSQSAVRTCRLAGSCATSTRTPATWLERSPRPRPSSNPAATASASRCCFASNASSGPPAVRPARGTRRVHPRRDRPEPAPPCEVSSDRRHSPWRALVSVRRAAAPGRARQQRGFETLVSPPGALPIADFRNKICQQLKSALAINATNRNDSRLSRSSWAR